MRMVRYFVQVCQNGKNGGYTRNGNGDVNGDVNGDANGDANGDDSKGLELGLGILIEQM